jgi:hypothetical protein
MTTLLFRAAVFAVTLSAVSAFAEPTVIEHSSILATGTRLAEAAALQGPAVSYNVVVRPERRPAALMPMYAAQGVLQGIDVLTTFRALDAGHQEGNPLLEHSNREAMVFAKVAVTSVNILAAEKLWKKNRTAAVVLMAVSNAMMVGVVGNNANVLHRGR